MNAKTSSKDGAFNPRSQATSWTKFRVFFFVINVQEPCEAKSMFWRDLLQFFLGGKANVVIAKGKEPVTSPYMFKMDFGMCNGSFL